MLEKKIAVSYNFIMCAYVSKEKENRDYLIIDNDIRDGQLKNVYLLFGVESYLLYQYRDKLLRALDAKNPDNTMNYAEFIGKNPDESEIMSIADTMPFFADYRVIFIKDCELFKTGAADKLPDYIKKELPDTTYIIFAETEKNDRDINSKGDAKEVDRRNRMYKAVKERGAAVEFCRQSDQTLKSWIAGRLLKPEGKTMSGGTLDYFLSKTGNDMSNIKSETEKLVSYTMGRTEITAADIDAIVTTRLKDKVFDMIGFMAAGNQKKALAAYYELIALKVAVQMILYNITSQFNSMLIARDLKNRGCDNSTIAEKMGMGANMSWKVPKLLDQASNFTTDQLKEAVRDAVETDEKIKTGRINDRLGLEMLIVKYSTRK